jgi:predicted DNA-binding transcriptional regulator YafY
VERIERITLMHRFLKASRYGRTPDELMSELGCSRATVYRDLYFMRDTLGAPLDNDPSNARWRYNERESERFELPGLWLSAEEVYALLLTRQVIEGSSEGLLGASLARIQTRIEKQLGSQAANLKRLRVVRHGQRRVNQSVFRACALATLERRGLQFAYRARSTEEPSFRHVDPQRLVHYREHWYLDAFDHTREALRSFALDRMSEPQVLERAARDVDDLLLDAELASSYGIFSGSARQTAVIVFSKHAARWAAEEQWHSKQVGKFLPDGRFELRVPYANAKELLMDVLRYGPDAEITAPVALREQIRALLALTSAQYG